MKLKVIFLAFVFLLFACKSEVVKDNTDKSEQVKKLDEESAKPLEDKSSLDSLIMDNGLKIHWLSHGEGDKIVTGDCINIAYKVFLEDGKLIEGNHKLNLESFPFVVGFGMQTKGWDIALKQMKVGDEVEVFIPSALARGEKGIPGVIPPNSNNFVSIHILEKRKPTREIDGNKVYVFEENNKNKVKFNRENTIEFYTMTSSESTPLYYSSYRENKPYVLKMKDAGVVPGLKKSLNNAKRADRMYIVVPPQEAYGQAGFQGYVKKNEHLLFNIFVSDVY
jgi:FKBP-type peptidyl-prolyl cis-trans isomerase